MSTTGRGSADVITADVSADIISMMSRAATAGRESTDVMRAPMQSRVLHAGGSEEGHGCR
jgi:hypothetical protein